MRRFGQVTEGGAAIVRLYAVRKPEAGHFNKDHDENAECPSFITIFVPMGRILSASEGGKTSMCALSGYVTIVKDPETKNVTIRYSTTDEGKRKNSTW